MGYCRVSVQAQKRSTSSVRQTLSEIPVSSISKRIGKSKKTLFLSTVYQLLGCAFMADNNKCYKFELTLCQV